MLALKVDVNEWHLRQLYAKPIVDTEDKHEDNTNVVWVRPKKVEQAKEKHQEKGQEVLVKIFIMLADRAEDNVEKERTKDTET